MVKKTLAPIELQILALVVQERTGREVAALFEREAGRRIPFGSLYTSFRRMGARGLVTSREEPDEDGRIKYFLATPQGLAALQRSRAFYGKLGYFGLLAESVVGGE